MGNGGISAWQHHQLSPSNATRARGKTPSKLPTIFAGSPQLTQDTNAKSFVNNPLMCQISPWMHPDAPGATAPACCPTPTQQPSALAARPRVPIRSHSRRGSRSVWCWGMWQNGEANSDADSHESKWPSLNSFKGEVHTMMGRLVMQVYSRLIGNDHHCCAFHGRSNMPYWCLIGLFAICLCASSMKAVCWNRSHSCLQQKRTMFLRNTLRASPLSPLPGRLSNWKSFIRFLNQTNKNGLALIWRLSNE